MEKTTEKINHIILDGYELCNMHTKEIRSQNGRIFNEPSLRKNLQKVRQLNSAILPCTTNKLNVKIDVLLMLKEKCFTLNGKMDVLKLPHNQIRIRAQALINYS